MWEAYTAIDPWNGTLSFFINDFVNFLHIFVCETFDGMTWQNFPPM